MPALRPVATCLVLSLLLTPAFAADQNPAPATAEPAAAGTAAAADSDLAYIQDKGTLVIGINHQ